MNKTDTSCENLCKFVKTLESVNLITEFEKTAKYTFCDSFKTYITKNNGGRPNKRIFDTNKAKEREVKTFLSFNKDDKETVWKSFEACKEKLNDIFIPFAIDNFGNLICFNISNDNIIFLNHENLTIEIVAENFDDFIKTLRSDTYDIH